MKRKTKRKPEPKHSFPSIAAASARLGISITLLKDAKRRGCPAFRARGSIKEAELTAWLAEHSAELASGEMALRDRKTLEEIRKLKIANDFKEGVLIRRQSVVESIGRVAAAIDGLLERKLCEEYPSAVAGLDVAQARIYGRRLSDSIRELFMALAKEWRH